MKKGIAFVLTVVLLATLATGCASSMTVAEPTIEPVLSATAEPTVQQDAAQEEAVSIVDAKVNENGELILYMSNNTTINAGLVRGEDGKDGVDGLNGADGKDGVNGKNGRDGVDGKDGADGKDGRDGVDGTNGRDGVDGKDGKDGKDGQNASSGDSRKIELKNDGTNVCWRYEGDSEWQTLISLADITGKDGKDGAPGKDGADGKDGKDGIDGAPGKDGADGKDGKDGIDGADGKPGADGKDGADGQPGADGREVELRTTETHIQWRYVGDTEWKNLIALSEITGPKGDKGDAGEKGDKGDKGEPGEKGDKGDKGDPGDKGDKGDKGDPGLTPSIGENGNWFIGDQDTGVSAKGSGSVPSIGENGNWFIDGKDTGVHAGEKVPEGTYFTVTYDAGEGTLPEGTETTVKVKAMDTLESMPVPTAPTGKYFVGWFSGSRQINIYVPVRENLTLTAKYAAANADADGFVIVEDELFSYTGSAETVVVPDGITSIADGAFKNNTKVKQIVLPNTVKTIGAEAFYNCSSLESINVPEGLTRIEDRTFYQCTKLASFAFPSTLKYIGSQAFMYCKALETVTLNEGLTQMRSEAFMSCMALQTLSLPGTLEVIPNYAFHHCPKLQNIQWAEGVKTIGKFAFDMSKPGILRLPDSLEEIQDFAFDMADISSVVFGSNLKKIGVGAFRAQDSVYTAEKIIESISFKKCKQLTEISVGAFAFSHLTTISLPETVKKIGAQAFMSSKEYQYRIISVYCDAVVPPEIDGGSCDYPFVYGHYSGNTYSVGGRPFKVYVVSGSESAYKEDYMWKKARSIEAYK